MKHWSRKDGQILYCRTKGIAFNMTDHSCSSNGHDCMNLEQFWNFGPGMDGSVIPKVVCSTAQLVASNSQAGVFPKSRPRLIPMRPSLCSPWMMIESCWLRDTSRSDCVVRGPAILQWSWRLGTSDDHKLAVPRIFQQYCSWNWSFTKCQVPGQNKGDDQEHDHRKDHKRAHQSIYEAFPLQEIASLD